VTALHARAAAAGAAAECVRAAAWLLTGMRAVWLDAPQAQGPRVYFANHRSHIDFVLVWAVLPALERARTRAVAAADYWNKGALRRYFGSEVFRAVLVERDRDKRVSDPIADMAAALDEGSSLIIFPEGTRNTTDETLLPLKSGIFHLARLRPATPFVPVWIDDLARVMPKGELVPVPLLCTVSFGAALSIASGEDKDAFLGRARAALLALSPSQRERAA
jgi:1-acyl-sn-glycerol-3-phosphate acyltransferase